MVSSKWAYCRSVVGQIGTFSLLLMSMAVTGEDVEPTETSEEMSYNIVLDDSEPTTRSFRETEGTNYTTTPLPYLQYKSRAVMRSFLIRHRIIPEVLAIAPSYIIEVAYTKECIVNLGNKIDPAQLQKRPKKIVWPWTNGSFYSLVLIDADVPSRQYRGLSQRIHWLVINIPGNRFIKGNNVVKYMGPLAPPKTGMHRYVFAIFKQYCWIKYEGKRIKAPSSKLDRDRLHFSIKNFSMTYKLRDPIAVNFFLSGWPLDQYVPEFTPPPRRPRNSTYEPLFTRSVTAP